MKLQAYLKKNKIKPGTFARGLGISRQRLYHYFDGITPDLSMALKITTATNGEVALEDLVKHKRKAS